MSAFLQTLLPRYDKKIDKKFKKPKIVGFSSFFCEKALTKMSDCNQNLVRDRRDRLELCNIPAIVKKISRSCIEL